MIMEEKIKELLAFSPELPPAKLINQFQFQHNGKQGWTEANDVNQPKRLDLIKALYPFFQKEDKALIRFLLEQEITYTQELGDYTEGLNISSFMLYKIMDNSDVPLLYEAKFNTCFDARFTLDIELVMGLGLKQTKAFLNKNKDQYEEIIDVIKEYEKREFKTREIYLPFYEERRIPYLLEDEE